MTFSYNLVLALFLLAPGFAAFAGVFFTAQRDGRLHPAPPTPNSVLTLALVTLSALGLHALWATLLALQHLYVTTGCFYITVPFEPNIYLDLLRADAKEGQVPPFASADIAFALASLVALSAIGYGLTVWVITSRFAEAHLRGYLYGWAGDIVQEIQEGEPNKLRLVTAFVLTKTDHEGVAFGYEGLLRNLTLTADKEIASISLSEVTAFYVKMKADAFKRVVLPRTSGIPTLYMEKAEIRNVAFQVYQVPESLGETNAGVTKAPVPAEGGASVGEVAMKPSKGQAPQPESNAFAFTPSDPPQTSTDTPTAPSPEAPSKPKRPSRKASKVPEA